MYGRRLSTTQPDASAKNDLTSLGGSDIVNAVNLNLDLLLSGALLLSCAAVGF